MPRTPPSGFRSTVILTALTMSTPIEGRCFLWRGSLPTERAASYLGSQRAAVSSGRSSSLTSILWPPPLHPTTWERSETNLLSTSSSKTPNLWCELGGDQTANRLTPLSDQTQSFHLGSPLMFRTVRNAVTIDNTKRRDCLSGRHGMTQNAQSTTSSFHLAPTQFGMC